MENISKELDKKVCKKVSKELGKGVCKKRSKELGIKVLKKSSKVHCKNKCVILTCGCRSYKCLTK